MQKQSDKTKDSIVETCITKSKWICYAIAAKQSLSMTKYFSSHVPILPPDWDKLHTSVGDSWNDKIDDWKKSIARFLKRRFDAKDINIGPDPERYWFSTADLIAGYVFLYKNKPANMLAEKLDKRNIPDFILFLTEFNDTFDNTLIKLGDIRPYDDVKHNLAEPGFIPGVLDKKSIIVYHNHKSIKNGTESNKEKSDSSSERK